MDETIPDPAKLARDSSPPSKEELVRVTQGLSALFWTFPIIMYLAGSGLFGSSSYSIPHHTLWLALALLGIAVGISRLLAVKSIDPSWSRDLQVARGSAALCAFCSLFLDWWRAQPNNPYLLAHILGFVVVGQVLFLALARGLGHLAQREGDLIRVADFRLAFTTGFISGWIPLLGIAMEVFVADFNHNGGYALVSPVVYVGEKCANFLQFGPPWLRILLFTLTIFPAGLTLVGIWRLKSRVLARLAGATD